MRPDYKELSKDKTILITGAAGFIGYHLSKLLLEKGLTIYGYDSINDYYDVQLKHTRLHLLNQYDKFHFIKGDLVEMASLESVFKAYHPDIVVNLAAQAGVRYSIENPLSYMHSNIIGFFNILECCRNYPVKTFTLCFLQLRLWGKYEDSLLYFRQCGQARKPLCCNQKIKRTDGTRLQ